LNVSVLLHPTIVYLYTKCLIECNNYFGASEIFMSKLYDNHDSHDMKVLSQFYTKTNTLYVENYG